MMQIKKNPKLSFLVLKNLNILFWYHAIAFSLIAYKEGERNKNPLGKRQGAYSSVSIHIGINGGT